MDVQERPFRARLRLWQAITVLTAALCVALGLQVRNLLPLRETAETFRKWRMYPHPRQVVPTVRAATLAGDSVTIGETAKGRSQVLIIFTTSCPYCRETFPTWQRITTELLADSARRHDVFWVSLSPLDSTLRYVAENAVPAPVILPPDSKMMRVYRVRGVPMTLVLDHTGQIIHARPEVMTSRAAADSVISAARGVEELTMAIRADGGLVLRPSGR
jgi:hypothetical protein